MKHPSVTNATHFTFLTIRRLPSSTLFPTRRSSDLTVTVAPAAVSAADGAAAAASTQGQASAWRTSLAGTLTDNSALLDIRSEEHTSELQSRLHLVCRLLLEKKKTAESKRVLLVSSL